MFDALGFALTGDHIDFSFRDTAMWPRVSADEGMPPSLFISIGDPECGPDVQLVTFPPPPGPMWIDPHYHACDQFRVVIQGDFQAQRRRLTAATFGYQAAGIPYKEGFPGGSTEELWMLVAHGERRGARSTMLNNSGDFATIHFGDDQLDRPVASPDDAYWQAVPGGAKGTVGLGTTLGPLLGGFNWGSFASDDGWRPLSPGVSITAGLLSDSTAGPLLFTLRCASSHIVIPRAIYATEVVLAVVRGSGRVGAREYSAGEVRVQKAGVALDAIVGGEQGCDIVFMIADRRALPQVAGNAAYWPHTIDALLAELHSSH